MDIVDKVKHVYLFERDPGWVEALNATFFPYKEKVTIVPLFVGDELGECSTTLDEFFRDKQVDYIKADIEGAEYSMLVGGVETFKKLKGANICLYHSPEDEKVILNKLKEYGYYKQNISPGYLYWPDENIQPKNWLRRGVVYAEK